MRAREAKFVRSFQQRRAAHERLREMLDTDVQVRCIGTDGLSTEGRAQVSKERAATYIALLKDTGGKLVLQSGGQSNRVFKVYTWIWGWAGLHREVGISWNERPPSNQVEALFWPQAARQRAWPRPVL